jgi:hypothetical protein
MGNVNNGRRRRARLRNAKRRKARQWARWRADADESAKRQRWAWYDRLIAAEAELAQLRATYPPMSPSLSVVPAVTQLALRLSKLEARIVRLRWHLGILEGE